MVDPKRLGVMMFFAGVMLWFTFTVPVIDRTENDEPIFLGKDPVEHWVTVVQYDDTRDPKLWHCFVTMRDTGELIRYQSQDPNTKPETHQLPTGATKVVKGHWGQPMVLIGAVKHDSHRVEVGSEAAIDLYQRLTEVKKAYSRQNSFFNRRLDSHPTNCGAAPRRKRPRSSGGTPG